MKKILVLCMTIVMVMSLGVCVLADSDNFVSSPSTNQSPTIIGIKCDGEDLYGMTTIIPYAERTGALNEIRTEMETMYQKIVAAPDLSQLDPELKAVIEKAGLDASEVGVSDLFYIFFEGAESLRGRTYSLILSADTFKGFVSLLQFNNNEFEVIKDAKLTEIGGEYRLDFTTDALSSFAIVVRNEKAPRTGENNSLLYVALAVMVISLAALLALSLKRKKN